MLPIPDTAPTSQEEYDYLINATYQNGLEKYNIDKAYAQEQAAHQWEKRAEIIRERLIAQMEANLAVEVVDASEGIRALTDAEWQSKWNEGIKEIDARLANEYQSYVEQVISMVPQPQTLQDIDTMYSCYKSLWMQPDMPDLS